MILGRRGRLGREVGPGEGESPVSSAEAKSDVEEVVDSPRRGPRSISQGEFNDLAATVLAAVQRWSAENGYDKVPPIELLRQVTQTVELIGQHRQPPQ